MAANEEGRFGCSSASSRRSPTAEWAASGARPPPQRRRGVPAAWCTPVVPPARPIRPCRPLVGRQQQQLQRAAVGAPSPTTPPPGRLQARPPDDRQHASRVSSPRVHGPCWRDQVLRWNRMQQRVWPTQLSEVSRRPRRDAPDCAQGRLARPTRHFHRVRCTSHVLKSHVRVARNRRTEAHQVDARYIRAHPQFYCAR